MIRKHLVILVTVLLTFISSSFARTYTFIGSGNYDTPSNWAGGIVPPIDIISDTMVIAGNATKSSAWLFMSGNALLTVKSGYTFDLLPCGCATACSFAQAKVIIESGATFNCKIEIKGLGNLQVDGTFTSRNITGEYDEFPNKVTVNGIWEIGGSFAFIMIPIILNNGSYLHIAETVNPFSATSSITINPEAIFQNDGKIFITQNTFLNQGIIKGTGTFNNGFPNSGTVAPGNSTGVITVTGDYTTTSSANHDFEVGGTASNQYDRLVVSGTARLSGTLNVSLINGFTPTTDHDLPIITGTINGTFSSVNIPSQYSLVYTANSVILRKLTSVLWTGTQGTAWEDPANWSSGNVPDANTNVVINSGSTVVINSNVTIRTLTLNTGASLTVQPGYTLTITN